MTVLVYVRECVSLCVRVLLINKNYLYDSKHVYLLIVGGYVFKLAVCMCADTCVFAQLSNE